MSGFLYYVPGIDRTAAQSPAALGLGYAFEGQPVIAEIPRGGIDGTAGMVLVQRGTAAADDPRLVIDQQTWRKVPGTTAHVGYWTARIPKAKDLSRKVMLEGHAVELGDGTAWQCPIGRRFVETQEGFDYPNAVPHSYGVDDDGNWRIESALPQYAALWKVAERYSAIFFGAAGDDIDGFDFSGAVDAALSCIATNYRVGKAEVSALGLFNDSVLVNVLKAAIDLPAFEAWSKKKNMTAEASDGSIPAGSDSSHGQAA